MRRARRALLAAAALAAAALSSPGAEAFRSGRDFSEFKGTERVRWSLDKVQYGLDFRGAPGVAFDQVAKAVQDGATTWSGPACTTFTSEYLGQATVPAQPDDNRNTIQWVESGWASLGLSADTAGVTDLIYEKDAQGQWRIVEGDIYLNAEDHTWSIGGAGSTRDVQTIITHEFGHLLGLSHPCEPDGSGGAPKCNSDPAFASTTMYPLYDLAQQSLDQDDESGVCFLYPANQCEAKGCPEGKTCTPTGCLTDCNGTTCAEGEVCGASGCEVPQCPGSVCDNPCDTNADCPDYKACIEGTCRLGEGAIGDPCTRASDCKSRACHLSEGAAAGYCTESCTADASCSEKNATCSSPATPASGLGSCSTDLGGYGQACTDSGDCLGNQCLQVNEETPVCTRLCGAGHPTCPAAWECRGVENRQVCHPPDPPEDEGCAISPLKPLTHRPIPLWIVIASALTALAITRRRPS